MKARPILFNGPMIRALLAGSKTQTRRVVKPQPNSGPNGEMVCLGGEEWGLLDGILSGDWRCPYGRPGDLLWCRETWAHVHGITQRPAAIYRSDPMYDGCKPGDFPWQWRPSIHMPRWASRITLEITDVAVDQVQEISGIDARREGVSVPAHIPHDGADLYWARREFRSLWDSINAARGFGWDANPWVWCLSFRLIEANVDDVMSDPKRYGLGVPA
jgi:hypothetical protein